jgi:Leucine-rich repeat (LRR) protein/HEAT repeat protein
MKRKHNNLEQNISRLVKLTGDPDNPSKEFTESLTKNALSELAMPGKGRTRDRDDKSVKIKWSRILAYAAVIIIVCGAMIFLRLPNLIEHWKAKDVPERNGGLVKSAASEVITAYTLSEAFENAQNVQALWIEDTPELKYIGPEIAKLRNLTTIKIKGSGLVGLPEELAELDHLHNLTITDSKLKEFPVAVTRCKQLAYLSLRNNEIEALPPEIGEVEQLIRLDLGQNRIKSIPAEISNLKNLQDLQLDSNRLAVLPAEIGNLPQLTNLILGNNALETLPPEIEGLTSLWQIDLSRNKLSELPSEIGRLGNLQVLLLTSNRLTELPDEIRRLGRLRRLRVAFNALTQYPHQIDEIASLNDVRLHGNPISGKIGKWGTGTVVLADSRRGRGKTLSVASMAERAAPNKAKIEAEAAQIEQMAALGDVEGLIEMLSAGEFPSKVAAAEHLGEIGDDRALPELKRLNEEHGGWFIEGKAVIRDYDSSGAFAAAICRILSRDLPPQEQIEAWFDLLEAKGPAVPQGVKEQFVHHNFDVGRRAAGELDTFDDPSIVARLRQCENKGAAITAVWMEVRDMQTESAIARCVQIARDEGGAQRYGAIECLGKFGDDAANALDELAFEGHDEAVRVLGYQKQNKEVLELICRHLTDNKNYHVRLMAVNQFNDVLQYQQPIVLQALIEALYDPSKYIRRAAAKKLYYAAYRKNKPQLQQFEDDLLIALKHPDEEVRKHVMEALQRLGSERLDEPVADPPPIRTDLEEQSKQPLTAEQRLKAKTEPLEKEAAKALNMGPPEEAIKLYEQLLELRPDYEPYVKALEKARAYVRAAAQTNENWYPDAPYIGLKGRYSYLLARVPDDISTLQEEFDVAQFLSGEHFEGWSNIFGDHPKGKDQFEKALRLYEHTVKHYPENEYLVIRAKEATGGYRLNLYKDVEACVSAYTDIFALPVEEVVDSTDERRNEPLEKEGGKTQAQLDFERYYKDHLRERTIELCSGTYLPLEVYSLLDEIIDRCAETDPKIVEMANAAKVKVEQHLSSTFAI